MTRAVLSSDWPSSRRPMRPERIGAAAALLLGLAGAQAQALPSLLVWINGD